MKNILLFSVCINLFFGLKAQEQTTEDQIRIRRAEQKALNLKVVNDSTLQLDSIILHKWNSNISDWDAQPSTKYLYFYDEHGNNTQWIWNDWDPLTTSWMPVEHDTLWYNSLNNLICSKLYYYNTITHSWFLGYIEQYNDAGVLFDYIQYFRDEETFVIEEGFRGTYSLNAFDKPEEALFYDLDTNTGVWIIYERDLFFYTGDTVLVKEIWAVWENSSWKNYNQLLYNYTDGLLSESIEQCWDDLNSIWITTARHCYTYGIDKKVTEVLYQSWSGNQWKTTYHTNSIYDLNGNRIEYFRRIFDGDGLQTGGYHYISSYNSHNRIIQNISQNWNQSLNDWENSSIKFYYYTTIGGISETGKNQVFCHLENPYNPGTSITCHLLEPNVNYLMEVYSISGAQVFNRTFMGNLPVSIDKPLNNGLYMLVISDDKGLVYKNKLLIKN